MTFRGVGVAIFDQFLDHRDHLGDVFRGPWHVIGRKRSKRGHILKIPAHGFLGNIANFASGFSSARIDLVVYI